MLQKYTAAKDIENRTGAGTITAKRKFNGQLKEVELKYHSRATGRKVPLWLWLILTLIPWLLYLSLPRPLPVFLKSLLAVYIDVIPPPVGDLLRTI